MIQAPFRRIVTGHNSDGKAIVIEDGAPPRTVGSAESSTGILPMWPIHDGRCIPCHTGRRGQLPGHSL